MKVGTAGLEENGAPWVLPAQGAKAKMRSDSLKVTQVVVEQEPRLPVSKSPVFPGTNTEHLLESGQSSLALFYSRPPECRGCIGGFMARAKLSRTVLTLGLSGNRLFPLLSPASRVARELCWEAEWRGAVGQPALAGACAVHCSSLPPLFPRFKHRLCQLQEGTSVPQAGSRSRYLPGGAWQPWRRLKGRRTRVFCLSTSLCMAMLTAPLPPFPELIHGCY